MSILVCEKSFNHFCRGTVLAHLLTNPGAGCTITPAPEELRSGVVRVSTHFPGYAVGTVVRGALAPGELVEVAQQRKPEIKVVSTFTTRLTHPQI